MNCRNFIRKLALPVLLVLFHVAAFAQTQVTGRVTDPGGAGLAGVTVTVKGQSAATSTNENGQYTLTVPANATTLVFSSVGFGTREETLNGRSSINLNLAPTAGNLNEVVVVAYGTRRRGDLTASVTQVTAKDFQKGFIPSSEQLLQGKVAGVQITSGSGAAGGGSKIRIRGGASLNSTNEPLIVIDGVPVAEFGVAGTGNLLSTINPNDIESMSVLKDASATALYGSRASNGVIIITTKKGASGKLRFNFNTQASISTNSKKFDVLTGDEVRDIIGRQAGMTGDSTWVKLLGTSNTDWQDEIYRKAFGSDNTLSASGKVGFLPFRISGGYTFQEGTLLKNKFERISSSLNLTPKFFDDHLSVNLAAKFSNIKNNFSDQGAVGAAVNFDPTKPVNAENKFGGYYEWLSSGFPIDLATRNPLAMINLRNNTSTVNRVIGNIQLDYKLHFLPDLHVLVNAGMDYSKGTGNDNIDSISANAYKTGGRRTYYQEVQHNNLLDLQLYYAKEIKALKTKFDILVGHSYQEFSTDNFGFPSFSYRPIADPGNPALGDTIANSKPKPEDVEYTSLYALESYLGRANFTINDKYLISASLRRDASSKLSPETRIGYFPAVAVAWKLREEFFRSAAFISDLKLRASWGKTGQQGGIPYYSYLVRYNRGTNSAAYQFGNQYFTFLRPEGYVLDLTWETTQTTNLGVDFGILKNRISGSFDYYWKKTSDLLSNVAVAPGANFVNRITKNVGKMDIEGFEVALNTTPVRTQDLTWDFNLNFSYNKRRITKLQDFEDPNFKGLDVSDVGIGTGNFIGKHIVGYSPFSYYVYKQVYDQNGKPLEGVYEDLNRDGQINSDDRYLFKKPDADFLMGFSTTLNYKKFSASVTAHGQVGNYLYNRNAAGQGILGTIQNPLGYIGNAHASYLETGFRNNSNFQFYSDYFIQNASFLRIDNINIGYNVGRVFSNRAGMRLNASVQNVAVITKYTGLDPEVSNDGGIEGSIYPRPRIFTLGVNLEF
ncbi:MAG: SusC/RagA family TonB-linked outer membrane protein [Chitinophagaceae bacterium]|nr:MAG: SusC/RagA family TonB-linked outer membrane protein [Chitinophagaceae bacterium]